MGAAHPRYTAWSLERLVATPFIARVRPDEPPLRVLEQKLEGRGPLREVTYKLSFQRLVAEAWLSGSGPERLELASPANARTVRDAGYQQTGMLGHVHYLENVNQLDPAFAPQLRTSGPRLVFMLGGPPFTEVAPGIGLAVELEAQVRELVKRPDRSRFLSRPPSPVPPRKKP